MTLITMSAKEIDRFQIIKKLVGKHINGAQAAELLRLTTRQIRRLKSKVKQFGPEGLIHGNRGHESHNRIDEKKEIIGLLNKYYPDFGPTFASEKLLENHGLKHDPKTIRQIMIDEGLWQPRTKKKSAVHRAWRERRACYGEMIQFDGSYEHWFEDRNGTGEVCLLAAIDDATGRVVSLKFAEHEGVFPVFDFWQAYLIKNGRPRSIYLDKFSTYNINHRLAKENSDTLTQFERAADELRIELIKANSPQAKGRVECLFGTLQDRLIKELRLANISTAEEANIFLEKTFIPKFNARFSVEPRNQADLHQPLDQKESRQLPGIFSRQKERTILNDFTFSFQKQWYQLAQEQPATICKKDKVMVEERLDKTIHVRLRGKYLNYRILPIRPVKAGKGQPWIIAKTIEQINLSKAHIPPPNHPWRQMIRASAAKQLNSRVGHFKIPGSRTF